MKILYISISGNTRSFVKRLVDYADTQHNVQINVLEIHENSTFENETEPFFTFVPTYLDGGNGVDNGDTEILTETMREYLDYHDNYRYCLGVVGSGNKNFNHQYCLTAKQYAEKFGFPFLADYELRGTQEDIEHVYRILANTAKD
ncbi:MULTISPECIES: class Ib ribonucleoside-diphosphate reductase assembly flavoprotein NrdI [unclassified Enterococcus]|uniref:class Ib ribonucleoside-diphosphate reductase assembly flavoprotein NrdI n=1 Tax=unclassified Enterococcus TaxID=2608891 RepID=UPI001CE17AF3|nr:MULTISPECIES: class Ib ribonucleoside-diphosphate reductase assembly flavoprotein NrdI [unclassified Enterococcus]MCA5013016.1 class Ib ribonucleoside-diphosphate reductase assembly flavoprotein NrdI [Enterococcus sp. S23]MCA5016267.1 class Ib ribonucleoside-diphosphate reductase assembly flavoprotein NrdI [Enterococcus sp. S22(2020)]